MLSVLAQTAPAAATSWLVAFFWLVGGLGAVLGCMVAMKNLRTPAATTPQPLEVKAHMMVASKTEIDQLHGRIKREREELDREITALRQEDKALREKLDKEINSLQDRIDAVPERTINLLRHTKGLIGS